MSQNRPKSYTAMYHAPHNPYIDMINHDYARHHTGLMVKACREIGVQCDWLTIPETNV